MSQRLRQHWDTNAEAGVLGGVLLRNEVLRKLSGLEVADFRDLRHQSVFSAMRNLESAKTPIDTVTVEAELKRTNRWESLGGDAGGLVFLAELASRVPSPDNVVHYAEVIIRHRVTRSLVEVLAGSLELINSTENVDCDGEDAVQWVASEVRKIPTRGKSTSVTPGVIVRERLREYDRIAGDRERGIRSLTGLPTGIANLDRVLGGYQPGIVTVLCGRPAMGKSSGGLAAGDACSDAGLGVHTFSLEDPRAMLGDRLVARGSEVPTTTLRRAEFQRDEFERLRRAVVRYDARKHWLIEDERSFSAPEIVRAWRRSGEENETRIVVIDLLQRIRKTDQRMKTYDHVTEVMHLLSDAAKDDKIAVLLLAQLNRDVERRDDKRPVLSDLQDAGTVEQDAKCVIGYYRGSYYYDRPRAGIDFEEDGPVPSDADFQSTIQLCVLKDSNGATGRVFGKWHGPTTKLS